MNSIHIAYLLIVILTSTLQAQYDNALSPFKYQDMYQVTFCSAIDLPSSDDIRMALILLDRPMLLSDTEAINHPDYTPSLAHVPVFYCQNKEWALSVRIWRTSSIIAFSIHYNDGDMREAIHNAFEKAHSQNIKHIQKWHFDFTENKLDNPKIVVQETDTMGRGLFAREDIKKGEFIAGVYGKFFQAETCNDLPSEIADHTLQCSEHIWRMYRPTSNVVYFNHSCETNCAMSGYFDIIAIRDIHAGEQLFIDYGLFDDSNWEVPGGKCLCGAPTCRGIIMPYHQLPDAVKHQYAPYISAWLQEKYDISNN